MQTVDADGTKCKDYLSALAKKLGQEPKPKLKRRSREGWGAKEYRTK